MGATWSGNGPEMLTVSVRKFCPGVDLMADDFTACGNFTTVPTNKCYEVAYPEWYKFYEDQSAAEILNRLRKAKSYFVHLYNKMEFFQNKTYQIDHNSKSAYMQLARRFCPKVFETLERYF